MKIVATHRNADFDAFGAMVGVRLLDPEVVFFFPGGQEVALRSFLQTGVYPFEEIKNKAVKTAPIEQVYLVDTSDLSHLGNLTARLKTEGLPLTVYDHHEEAGFALPGTEGKREYRRRGSTCTILTEILREKEVFIPSLEATLLLMGIHEDTGHLMFQETAVEDIRAVETLIQAGADLSLVRRFTWRELTPHQLRLLNHLVQNARSFTIRGHRVTLSHLNLKSFEEDLAYVVHKYVDLFQENLFIGLFNEGNKVFLIGRSRHPDIDVASILTHFSGGGHSTAAAGVVRDRSVVEIKEELMKLLRDSLPPRITASEIMSPHVYGISGTETVQEALDQFNQRKVNSMPVFEHERPVGALTRQLVNVALHHGLADSPVEEIMSPRPPLVPGDLPLEELPAVMKQNGVRFVLVGREEKVLGIVTRMDVYRHLLPVSPEVKKHLEERLARISPGQTSITRKLQKDLPEDILKLLHIAGKTAEEQNVKVYLVGGIVRDLLLSIPNEDVDIVVEGDGIRFASGLASAVGARLHTHEKFLTAKLVLHDGRHVDVATARSEYYRAPASLPSVQAGILRQDLYRRDFTINTLTISLNPSTFGRLVDFFGGYQDLKGKHIRILHSLSFIEDPTRAFRAVHFAVRLDFSIAEDTRKLIRHALKRGALSQLSGTRLWEELRDILRLPNVEKAVELMAELNLLSIIHSEASVRSEFRSSLTRLRKVLFWAFIEQLDPPTQDLLVLMLLLEDVNEWQLGDVAGRLDLRGRASSILITYRKNFRFILNSLKSGPVPSEIYTALEHIHDEHIYFAMAFAEEANIRDSLRGYLKTYRHITLRIRGKDLLDRGIPPGPHVGKALRVTLLAKLDGKVKTRDEEVEYAVDACGIDPGRDR